MRLRNLRQLEHFVAVVEAGTIGRAAQRIHLSQAALSKSIQQLEEELGVELFHRGPRGMEPTVFGECVANYTLRIRAELARAREELANLKGQKLGHVSVGGGPSFIRAIFPNAVARFHQRVPEASVTVHEGMAESLMAGLLNGTLDLAVGARVNTALTEELSRQELFQYRAVLVAGKNHPFMRMENVTLQDLSKALWILPAYPDTLRQHIAKVFLDADLDPPKPFAESNSVSFMTQLLAQVPAVSLLPESLLNTVNAREHLAIVPAPECTWERTAYVYTRRSVKPSPLARLLLAEIQNVVAEMVQSDQINGRLASDLSLTAKTG